MKIIALAIICVFCSCSHSSKKPAEIQQAINAIEKEHKQMLADGLLDGSGYLYRSTASYRKFSGKFSEDELKLIHSKISPAVPYYPEGEVPRLEDIMKKLERN